MPGEGEQAPQEENPKPSYKTLKELYDDIKKYSHGLFGNQFGGPRRIPLSISDPIPQL